MKPDLKEWIDKAEADFGSAGREYRARKQPNYDAACFFSQQCVEKYLKARLVEAGIAFPKTHDLEVLLDLILPVEPSWDAFRSALNDLTGFAVAFRYLVSQQPAKWRSWLSATPNVSVHKFVRIWGLPA